MRACASDDAGLSEPQVAEALAKTFEALPLEGKRVLVIIPDGTRTAPISLLFRLLGEILAGRVSRLDYLIALGTHPPMSDEAIDRLVGVPAAERAARYSRTTVFNHQWDRPDALTTIGTISREETLRLTDGLLGEETAVTINRRLLDYDHIIICGPVFPHEVAGFSGGAKYLFPGVAGPEIINYTHWLGALVTCMKTIGVKDTPVRRVIHRAAELFTRPLTCLALVMRESRLCALYAGAVTEAFDAAADYSARLNIIYTPCAYRSVLSAPSTRYDDLWTAAKAMYKTEPVIEDGGEVIIYAPHITEVSYSHGALIDQVGYHVRDYFLGQWERFRDTPGMILAHSTHVRGAGTYDAASGVESPRIRVTLATGIPRERCERINLGYRDYREINPRDWAGREDEGRLLVEHAGEVLYRLRT
ncbi:MAG TPA: lactate racemase domain-containing protein [Ktedonobacterales bacterium]|nr:lactate racemase domain-containing protein [Ktedonobacterales bacterium]